MAPPNANNYHAQIQYEEEILLLPFCYSVRIFNDCITFGYGMPGQQPWACASKTQPLANIKPDSVVIGNASWLDNLSNFGGWGIRYSPGIFNEQGITIIAYNPANGPYIEFVEMDSGKKYHFVSKNVYEVAALLRQGGNDTNTNRDEDLDVGVNSNISIYDTDSNCNNDQERASLMMIDNSQARSSS